MSGPSPLRALAPLVAIAVLVGLLLLPTSSIAHLGDGTLTAHVGASISGPLARDQGAAGHLLRAEASEPSARASALTSADGPAKVGALPERAHPAIVNPVQFYTREPAPMGIADFGVTGKSPGARAYAYSTTSFQGHASVRSLSVAIGGSSSKVTAFELNSEVVFLRNGISYVYWIQNGLHLDASSHQFTIGGAYVWNFSAPGATLTAGDVRGNAGSVLASDTYYFIPGCGPTYPGQCSTMSLPASLTGRTVTSSSAGIPYVEFAYDLGSGWVTYDNVSFPHLANASDAGFRVDGFSPTPYAAGLYYDAEWVWVGAGGGSASTDQESDIDLSLSWWNGHNYQAVPTAWNFGSNTGETSSNVTEVATNPLGAHLAAGAGTLEPLYNLSSVGFLDLSAPTRSPSTVLVDGQAVSFEGGEANVTLPVGSHSLYLQNFTNASAQFTIDAGGTTRVNLTGAGKVTFNETGLPAGTAWGVHVNGTSLFTIGTALSVNLANGTYALAYPAVPGYAPASSDLATLTLPGTSQVSVVFAPFTFEVTVTESGLPASTAWWVNASGVLVQSTDTSLQVPAPNGSTPYEAGSVYEFLASPSQGTILVSAGVASPVSVEFSYRPTYIVGTVIPANANVSIDGVAQALDNGRFNDSVIPGSYQIVATASCYATAQRTVTATSGNLTWQNLSLIATPNCDLSPAPAAQGGGSIVPEELALVAAAAIAAVAVLVYVRRRR